MAQVLVVLEEKILVVPFGVETTRLSCISIIPEMVVTRKLVGVVRNLAVLPPLSAQMVYLLYGVLYVIPPCHGKC